MIAPVKELSFNWRLYEVQMENKQLLYILYTVCISWAICKHFVYPGEKKTPECVRPTISLYIVLVNVLLVYMYSF